LGIDAAKGATRWEALEPVRQAVRRCFGAIHAQAACGLELRHELQQWAELYNEQWLIERHGSRPPVQRRRTITLRSKSWPHDE
jgi:hypothetical protein